ncbi:MAG: MBL fold metallo-hydrolase [Deltaproteobacteria bacterium]|nr:MBL fold metallo-hydrolase [Deltaproteobacteria bacterium]
MIILKIFAGCVIISLITLSVFFLLKAHQVNSGREKIDTLLEATTFPKLENPGSVESLMILPLIDFYTDRNGLETEPGVSYLIKADDTTILMDVGFNQGKTHPSPLLNNMNALKINIPDIDMIFISHIHPDHVGGMSEAKKSEFSISQGSVEIGAVPVFSPEPLKPSKWNPGPVVEVVTEPKIITFGIATLGPIPRFLFLAGRTDEQVLAINLKGKGIVLIVGCGHPTIERIIERTKMVFDQPIYAIIGGLHLIG